jgi:antitoxin component YwqK of YwqJK toxin-antitoxin module
MRKHLIRIILLALSIHTFAKAQTAKNDPDLFDAGTNLPKFINTKDSVIKLHILEDIPEIEVKEDRMYYWFTLNQVHKTKGGYSGKVLNGLYQVFSSTNDLIEQGDYKNGLKTGKWIRWYKNGQIASITNWINGALEGEQLTYNDNGVMETKYIYANNALNGKSYIYNSDSTVTVMQYKKGRLSKTTINNKPKGNKR